MRQKILNEKDWLSCLDEDDMVQFLKERFHSTRRKYAQRKARLFVVACCRQVWPLIKDERARRAVEVLEMYADGQATPQELLEAELEAAQVDKGFVMALGTVRHVSTRSSCQIGMRSKRPLPVWYNAWLATNIPVVVAGNKAHCDQTTLLRDIFGIPFNAVAIERACQTAEIVNLARTIYEKRNFTKLPALAKALRDAGCSDKTILSHCRTEGPHVRGCWVVDLILAKRGGRTQRS